MIDENQAKYASPPFPDPAFDPGALPPATPLNRPHFKTVEQLSCGEKFIQALHQRESGIKPRTPLSDKSSEEELSNLRKKFLTLGEGISGQKRPPLTFSHEQMEKNYRIPSNENSRPSEVTFMDRDSEDKMRKAAADLESLSTSISDSKKKALLYPEPKLLIERLSKQVEAEEKRKQLEAGRQKERLYQSFRESSRAFQPDCEAFERREQACEAVAADCEEQKRKYLEEEAVRREMEQRLQEREEATKRVLEELYQEREKMLREMQQLEKQKEDAEQSKIRHVQEVQQLEQDLQNKHKEFDILRDELVRSEAMRINSLAQLQELRGNLRIYCRVKPAAGAEDRVVQVRDKAAKEVLLQLDNSKKSKPAPYSFDLVFDEASSQGEVFKEIFPFVQGTIDGKNISIFAYGPTGSGKTYTLEGMNLAADCLSAESGIIPRSLELIIGQICKRNEISKAEEQLEVRISCLEIYNERLNDLLRAKASDEEVQILMKNNRVVLPDVERVAVSNIAEALSVIKLSSQRRQVEATAFNSRSSRSHSIYRITIVRTATLEEVGLLNIIDMAGSEKNSADLPQPPNNSKKPPPAQSVPQSDKLKKIQKEANFINKSLTTLGRIIRQIKHQRTMGIKDMGIPYRESKLTRMLQDCLGGNAQTLMIVNINPALSSLNQTKETLNFASIACV